MKIYGLQKMTLLDYPGRIACTVFLSGCDMRCPWCHNSELAEGKAPAVMTSEELISFLKKRQGMLEGVAVTGGEPLLREESLELLREIRALGGDRLLLLSEGETVLSDMDGTALKRWVTAQTEAPTGEAGE